MKLKNISQHEIEHKILGIDAKIRKAMFPSAGGASSFLSLTDTPDSYAGHAGESVTVNAGSTGLDFTPNIATDEKVKITALDTTAGYLENKILAGTGITVTKENAGGNEDLKIATTITQYTDALAVSAIKSDAAWHATNWDTAYGWGNHASAGYVKTDQTVGQTIGATGARLTKLWATDITVTNAITGSITGNAATVTTNANLTGPITSSGNATSIASQTGTGTKFVVDTSPTIVTPTISGLLLQTVGNSYAITLSPPGAPTGTPGGAGTGSMADGDYYYVITAGDAVGVYTSKGTESAKVTVSTGGANTGSVALTWTAIQGAATYNIYRTQVSGTYTTPALIANILRGGLSYTDTAASPSAGAPPATNLAYASKFSSTGSSWIGNDISIRSYIGSSSNGALWLSPLINHTSSWNAFNFTPNMILSSSAASKNGIAIRAVLSAGVAITGGYTDLLLQSPAFASGSSLDAHYGLRFDNWITATNNYPIYFAGTGSANGIWWGTGTSNLYSPSATNVKTDGNFITVGSITDGSLTSGRVTYAGTGGLLQDSVNLIFNGTKLTTVDLTTTGNTILGDASTDTITLTGRAIFRTTASDPQDATAGNRPAGSVGEIAYYNGKWYGCTNAATPTWEKFTSA